MFHRNPLFSSISHKVLAVGASLLVAGAALAQESGPAAPVQEPQANVSENRNTSDTMTNSDAQPAEPAQATETTAAPVAEHSVLTVDGEAEEITGEGSKGNQPLAKTEPGTAKIEMLETGRVYKIEDTQAAAKPTVATGVAEVRNLETGEIAVIDGSDAESPKVVETLGPVDQATPSRPRQGNN